jgi:PqqD family protein of HPr-rel-A system
MPEPRGLDRIRWQTLNYPDLLREDWEDEWFLFNPASGNTHVLNRLAIDILDRIHIQSASLPELAQALIEEYCPDEPSRFTANLEQHLRHLDELGLITPLTPRTASA